LSLLDAEHAIGNTVRRRRSLLQIGTSRFAVRLFGVHCFLSYRSAEEGRNDKKYPEHDNEV
jgi:hypothetical protein